MDTGYVWDEEKYKRVRTEHDVRFAEVVDAFEDPFALEELDPQGKWGRFLLVGQTPAGRVLQVMYSEEELPVVRLITAYEANEYWRGRYERRQR
jgi:uncharacterized DUF497 family protein